MWMFLQRAESHKSKEQKFWSTKLLKSVSYSYGKYQKVVLLLFNIIVNDLRNNTILHTLIFYNTSSSIKYILGCRNITSTSFTHATSAFQLSFGICKSYKYVFKWPYSHPKNISSMSSGREINPDQTGSAAVLWEGILSGKFVVSLISRLQSAPSDVVGWVRIYKAKQSADYHTVWKHNFEMFVLW